jgi:hypothetical protein
MQLSKNLETSIGFASIILALSPFSDELKNIVVSSIFKININVFHLYFFYSLLFTLFIIAHFYFDAFISKTSNVSFIASCLKYLAFLYYFVLTFIPIITLNVVLSELLFRDIVSSNETMSFYNEYFFHLVALQFILLYVGEYRMKFKNFKEKEFIKRGLIEDIKWSNYLFQVNDFKELSIFHCDLAKKYLTYISSQSLVDWKQQSITDAIVKAYKQGKISSYQKGKFEGIASSWDNARYSAKSFDTNKIFLNNLFLEEEVNRIVN